MASKSKEIILKCNYHSERALIEDYRAGDMICSECGLVVGEKSIAIGCKWHSVQNHKNTRIGAAEAVSTINEHDNISTEIKNKKETTQDRFKTAKIETKKWQNV